MSPALSPASLSSASRPLGKRPKSCPLPSGGVHGRLAAESRTQRLTGGNTALHLHLREFLALLRQIVRAALLQRLTHAGLTIGIHLREEQSLLLGAEAILERLLSAVAPLQIHLQCVADTTGIQIVVGINVQPVIILGGTDIFIVSVFNVNMPTIN